MIKGCVCRGVCVYMCCFARLYVCVCSFGLCIAQFFSHFTSLFISLFLSLSLKPTITLLNTTFKTQLQHHSELPVARPLFPQHHILGTHTERWAACDGRAACKARRGVGVGAGSVGKGLSLSLACCGGPFSSLRSKCTLQRCSSGYTLR